MVYTVKSPKGSGVEDAGGISGNASSVLVATPLQFNKKMVPLVIEYLVLMDSHNFVYENVFRPVQN